MMSSAVSKALSIVVRMTPTGPVFTQPLQYRPAREWNTTQYIGEADNDSVGCVWGVWGVVVWVVVVVCVCGVSLKPRCVNTLGYVWVFAFGVYVYMWWVHVVCTCVHMFVRMCVFVCTCGCT